MLGHIQHPRRIAGVTAVAAILLVTTSAIAARPKAGGHFKGTTSATKINGFGAPVSFTVAENASKLTAFRYDTFGCFGSGGFGKGNPYAHAPGDVQKVGTIRVSKTGGFSVAAVKTTYVNAQGYKTVTTSSISGSFASAKHASGSITYSQTLSLHAKRMSQCGPAMVTFSVAAK